MLETTLNATKEILKADPSLSVQERNKLISLLRNPAKPTQPDTKPELRIVRRREAAKLFSISPRTIDIWGASGLLRRVKLPGRKRACGFLLSEIAEILQAKTA